MNPFEEDVHEAFECFEETDDGLLLLEVFRRAAQYGIPAPTGAYLALKEILERYHSGECRTLDEAFNVTRPSNWKQSAHRRKRSFLRWQHSDLKYKLPPGVSMIGRLWLRAKDMQAEGMPTDAALWEALAAEFHVSASRAKEWFYQVENCRKG
ncbi:MAG TPA: hypothetical protein PKZ76_16290 [Xanthomonadaceae bacterium]|nr:hypothetical protein [Xanthomonadaceae bacterium]